MSFIAAMHTSLPHPLAVTYLQALDVFSPSCHPTGTGGRVAKRAIAYLNTALLSPQMLYLTHQRNALAVASVYMAAREEGVKLPTGEWWQVFDVEREELGFLCLGMGSLAGWVKAEKEVWGEKGMITRADVREELKRRGTGVGDGLGEIDEEAEMGRLLDEKVA
jgi:cyclin L